MLSTPHFATAVRTPLLASYIGVHSTATVRIWSVSAISTVWFRQEQIFTHTGWREFGSNWVYLHAGGAIGATGPIAGVQVTLPPQLTGYELLLRVDADSGVRESLRILAIAPDRITFPLLAAAFRAALGEADFSVFLTGRTGVFKTALATLAQQHFGRAITSGALPGNFSSTGNALELLAFYSKDALLVVDDFAPTGRDGELRAVAQRLFRAAGNGQGRSRLGSDGHLQPQKGPRGMVLATGEEVPNGQSIRARMLILEVGPGDVDVTVLSECQQAGSAGLFSQTMGAFVRWIAGRYGQIQERRGRRMIELRAAGGGGTHARTAAIVAELQAGFEIFLEFCIEMGAITLAERADLEKRALEALRVAALGQFKYQQDSDVALRFLALLRAALICGRAHVADRQGGVPARAERWGWRDESGAWTASGIRIGWVDHADVYVDPAASYTIAQDIAGPDRFPISEQTLRLRLNERGLLASVDMSRQTLKVRRTIEGGHREVLHLRASDLGSADAACAA